jgi:hypothetical protein
MDGGLVTVLVVLDILVEVAGGVDGKDIAKACIVVEWVAVYGIRWLFGREKEDGTCFRIGVVGSS